MSVDAETPGAALALGFLGTGWIGRHRMEALLDARVDGAPLAVAAAVADPDPANRAAALALAPGAVAVGDLEGLLELDRELDGIVVATPSALHAPACLSALAADVPVFCQKPLARTLSETEAVLAAAQRLGRPLGVDLSYRETAAVAAIREAMAAGAVGDLHAIELVFHNAYGPDKPWFLDRRLAGGGALIDLGTHLLDLALWLSGATGAQVHHALLRRRGRPLEGDGNAVEDFVWAELETDTGVAVRIACSWFLPAGRDCEIAVTLYGHEDALALHNVGGSFYDFCAEHRQGTATRELSAPPDDWGGRALLAWARRLAAGDGFDPVAAAGHRATAAAIDAIYARGGLSR